MAIKTSIYINDRNEQFLGFFRGEGEDKQLSGNIGYALAGYRKLLRLSITSALPKLGHSEWGFILQAYNGHIFTEDDHRVSWRIVSLVADELGIENIMNISDASTKESLEKIASLTQAEEAAVIEVARMFWSNAYKSAEGEDLIETINGIVGLL